MKFPLFLREALPYLQKFSGKIFVIKAGGAILAHPDFSQILRDIATLAHLNIRVILVFGAGPQFDKILEKKKISCKKIDGLRVTTAEMLPILQKIIADDAKKFVESFAKENIEIARIEKFLRAKKFNFKNFSGEHFTGSVAKIDEKKISQILDEKKVPLAFSIIDEKNCNADDVVLALARNLRAEKVIFLTGTRGIFVKNKKNETELLRTATPKILENLILKKEISGGMIPKSRAAAALVRSGIAGVHIISGFLDGTLLTEIFTNRGCGTMILPEKK